jgi:signal transduction histidine kinase/DNA-binding response OmpR family regulator
MRALAKTPDGRWWLGTSKGLVEARPNAAGGFDFRLWEYKAGNDNSPRNNDVSSLLPDPKDANALWIGTKGGGLARMDIKNGQFRHLTTRNGLPNDVIYAVLPDPENSGGCLWLSSNKGLTRYHPESGQIKNFTEADGLQSDEFNTWAYGKTPTGELMFGGVKGLNVFHPKDIQDNPHLPRAFLTGLKINNHTITPGDSTGLLAQTLEFTEKIRLPFHQNSITLEFAALEYTAPSKNRFRYYLEGAEAEWAHESSEPSAQYLNLSPGDYVFKVMACNNDGVWNPAPASLRITVLPPWYRSWLAYLFYAAAVGGLIWLYMRFRLGQLRLEQKLALEHREAERIRELDEFKSRLFTNITHEFRTPLTVVLGTSEQLEKQAPESVFPDLNTANTFAGGLKNRLALIRRNGRNLLDLVNQLLDLAKAESNQLKIHLVQGDVVRYVRYVVESFHSLSNQRNVLLTVDSKLPELAMDYDPEKLRQILSNLISNALKYTPSGGKIAVFITHHASFIILKVADSGAGIAPEDLSRIFDRFYQADNAVAKAGGTGIGLALTKELVKLLGGEITAESEPGKGSTFTVRLPITNLAEKTTQALEPIPEPATSNLKPETSNQQPQTGSRLLLVEDNPDVVEYLRLCLEGRYQLHYAYNGRAGIEQALELVPDLVLSDVMMPEKDGFEVCDFLKNDERTSHIPVVLLTAKADVESRIAGLRRGADAYLAKPFHPEELLATLQNLLELRRKLQARYAASALSVSPQPDGDHPPTAPSPSVTDIEDVFLQKLRAAVEARLGEADLSAEDVCRAVGMGRSNLYAKLSALTDLSFNVYVRTLRLQKAKTLLESTDLNVSEVAYEVGFNDPKYFSRVFSEQFGVAPSALRK